SAKNAPPCRIAQHCYLICAEMVFFRYKSTPQNWPCPKNIEPLPGHTIGVEMLRHAVMNKIHAVTLLQCCRLNLILEGKRIGEIRNRDHRKIETEVGILCAHDAYPLRGIHPRRMHQHRVNHAENGCIRTDTEGKRRNRRQCESGSLAQLPQRKPQILE